MVKMRVLFVPYNEDEICCKQHNLKNGSIDELIRISKDEYLIFQSRAICRKNSSFPKKILIRGTKYKDFYLGDLIRFEHYKDCPPEIWKTKHRPQIWIEMDKYHNYGGKSVFFISNLQPTNEPVNLKGKTPQRPIYVDIEI